MAAFDYDKSVRLYYDNESHRGPGKVVQNLTKGLKAIGVTAEGVWSSRPLKYNGWLQNCNKGLLQSSQKSNEPRLLGPNLFVLPPDDPELCKLGEHFVVPSQWVKDLYASFEEMRGKQIHVWPVGIDTDQWMPLPLKPTLDCFIYFKNRAEQDLAIVEAICRKFNLKYEVLKYGQYQESELAELCMNVRFAILLTGTESQGIAYMQILSANKPCYVFNNPTWKGEWKDKNGPTIFLCPASSVPYFDDRCGEIASNVSLEHFSDFLKRVDDYAFRPREYILENHTLEKSAQKYFDLLRISNGEQP